MAMHNIHRTSSLDPHIDRMRERLNKYADERIGKAGPRDNRMIREAMRTELSSVNMYEGMAADTDDASVRATLLGMARLCMDRYDDLRAQLGTMS